MVEAENQRLSRRRFAIRCGLDPQAFNDWVSGEAEPSLPNLKLIGKVFGVPWEWLLIGDEGLGVLKRWDSAKRPTANIKELARD